MKDALDQTLTIQSILSLIYDYAECYLGNNFSDGTAINHNYNGGNSATSSTLTAYQSFSSSSPALSVSITAALGTPPSLPSPRATAVDVDEEASTLPLEGCP